MPYIFLRDGVTHWHDENTGGFVTKDSGERQEFETGAMRDTQNGKPRYDLIPPLMLRRLAELYARGAEKYGENNYQRGIPLSRLYASLFRHLMQWAEGTADGEDHEAAVIWNMTAIMWTEQQIRDGKLPKELADFGPLSIHRTWAEPLTPGTPEWIEAAKRFGVDE